MKRIKKLGEGGLGIVTLYQENNGGLVAVKQMKLSWNIEYLQRFWREIDIMKSLHHKNIVGIVEYDKNPENPYYKMPFYKEGSLRDKINELRVKNQRFTDRASTAMVLVIANAMKYAHQGGAIHRDLKPENILFKDNEPIISDWGIGAFIHRESQVLQGTKQLGTKSYCSPEQWETGICGATGDIYSLGLIYRELVTGSIAGQIENIKIANIVDKMTAFDSQMRFQNMSEVIQALKGLNIIENREKPINDFWADIAKGVLICGGVLALLWLFSEIVKKK